MVLQISWSCAITRKENFQMAAAFCNGKPFLFFADRQGLMTSIDGAIFITNSKGKGFLEGTYPLLGHKRVFFSLGHLNVNNMLRWTMYPKDHRSQTQYKHASWHYRRIHMTQTMVYSSLETSWERATVEDLPYPEEGAVHLFFASKWHQRMPEQLLEIIWCKNGAF